MNYHKFKQVLVPIAAAVPDVISLQEYINAASGHGMCPLMLQMHLFPFLSGRRTASNLRSHGMDNILHS